VQYEDAAMSTDFRSQPSDSSNEFNSGTPSLLSRLEGDSRAKRWIKAHLDYPHTEWCIIWPFSRGEGKTAQFGYPQTSVSRLLCEYRNGPPPTPKHQAAHSCGRGHDGCCNQNHLSWKTNSENQLERFQHSGPARRSKLTPLQVDEIRALKDRAKLFDVAKQFGVSEVNIRSIWSGKLWNNTSSLQRRVFTDDEIRSIRAKPYAKLGTVLAKELGVSDNIIFNIRAGRTYRWVTP
jgi:hypothetical protein